MRPAAYLAAAAAMAFVPLDLAAASGRAVKGAHENAASILLKAESAYDESWDRAPMSARRVYFVTRPVKQHGAYEPRGDNTFGPTETVVSYIEPVGFAFRDLGDGVLAYGFKVALVAKRADGSVLFDKPDYATLDSRTRSRKHDVEFDSSLDVKALAPGTYTLEFVFHDLYSDKRMAVSQTFRVVASSPPPVRK